MQSITQHDLERLLMRTSRCQTVSLASITNPDMRSRNNPYHQKDDAGRTRARKVTLATGFINWQYERTVRRQQAREATPDSEPVQPFKAKARQWGTRIKHCPLVTHTAAGNGEQRLYLEVKIQTATVHYFDRNTGDRLTDGQLEKLRPFLRTKSRSRQPVEKEIILRDYRLINLAELSMDRIRYSIAPAAAELQTYFLNDSKPAVATARPASESDTRQRQSHPGAIF